MVVPAGVEGEFAEQFTVGGEYADVQVADQDEDAGVGVAAAEADVVQPAAVPQGDDAGGGVGGMVGARGRPTTCPRSSRGSGSSDSSSWK